MKIHITNLYNFSVDDKLVQKQHRFAEVGRALGFYEMGIFSYPVETDSASELSKRLDGVIAALEPEDVVFMQLPTQNGLGYERQLLAKMKGYRDVKIVLILHEANYLEPEFRQMADYIITPISKDDGVWFEEFYIKKELVLAKEAVLAYRNALKLQQEQSKAPSSEEVQVGFGLYDKTGNYTVWVGVAMQAVIESTKSKVCFHILHDETLNEKNKNRLVQVAVNGGQRIQFHYIDKTSFQDLEAQMQFYTIGALFRILLPEIMTNLSRIIYLDADILAHRDIKELWDMDISDYYMAAVPDLDVVRHIVRPIVIKRNEVPAERYFNSGVIYMNLDKIRVKGNMRHEIVEYLRNTKESNLPDQDALNVIYGNETLLLDGVWNTFVRPLQDRGEKEIERRFYHYVGTRPVFYSMAEIDRLYYEITSRTPWKEVDCRIILDRSLNRINDRVDQLTKLLSVVSDEKRKKIFYGEETYSMRNLYQLLPPREIDYRIGDPKEHTVLGTMAEILPCRDVSTLILETEPFVVLVLPEAEGGKGIGKLEELGLENGKDYFVIPRLLAPGKGGYM